MPLPLGHPLEPPLTTTSTSTSTNSTTSILFVSVNCCSRFAGLSETLCRTSWFTFRQFSAPIKDVLVFELSAASAHLARAGFTTMWMCSTNDLFTYLLTWEIALTLDTTNRSGLPCTAETGRLQMSKRRGRQNATRISATSSREMPIVPAEALRQAA